MKEIKLKDKIISEHNPVFFIGEIGINHNGSVKIAKQLINIASMLGIDAVKFQKRTPELCVPNHKKNEIRETPWGKISYIEYKKKIEFGKEEYEEIDKYCKKKKIMWSASAWDIPSFKFIESFDVPFHKVASAKITHKELLEEIKKTNKPVFLSTGGATLEQIKKAVSLLEDTNPLVIMHCNSGYPAKDEELNLNVIKTLKRKFPNHIIGYSGHERGISATLVAATLGAKVIERHITLDRTMWGTDQSASIEYPGIRKLVRDLKKLNLWLGDGIKKVYRTEKEVMNNLRDKDTL